MNQEKSYKELRRIWLKKLKNMKIQKMREIENKKKQTKRKWKMTKCRGKT